MAEEINMRDKRIWYFGLLTLSFLGLTFITGCLSTPGGDLETPVDTSASESESTGGTSTTTNTTNIEQIIINPAEVCMDTTSSTCTDDAELHKRIPYDSIAIGLGRPNDLLDSLLLEKVVGISTSYADIARQVESAGDQLFSFINFTFSELVTAGFGVYPVSDTTTDGYYFYFLIRFSSAMSDEEFTALGTTLASGTQTLNLTSDTSTITLEITQTEVGTDYYVVSLTDTTGTITGSQLCIIDKQIVACTSSKDMLVHLKDVRAGTLASISDTEKDDYFGCNHIEGFLSVPEMIKWAEASDTGVDVTAWSDFDGVIWAKFNSYSASYVVDATDADDLFGYGNLQTTYLNNNELQARVTAEVTESFLENIFLAYGL